MASEELLAERQWMTVDEVASYLGMKKSTIYARVSERTIPHYKVPDSNQVRFRKEKIDTWMESGQVKTIAENIAEQLQQKELQQKE